MITIHNYYFELIFLYKWLENEYQICSFIWPSFLFLELLIARIKFFVAIQITTNQLLIINDPLL